ncbi:uncharacterized protein GGS22DRAFT_193095 [Annulohypoxylon maeteangense]|uniref:uncharacterized protein n=1 Tax=Annulohypoxylon maeteangense TaxID=1927788 RepID=UPI0020081944|nr:uncharacterized protein GGS22DRAFT_193095 [Annulohypoxylon maeteangense]KAI0880517.1 hypothetical protein GGS22DRAFT_193095 [Annulohypoxylon maeteangense]
MTSDPALTFGVELEFLVTTRKEHENNQETYEAIAELFLRNLANPLPCACVHGKWSKYRGTAYRYPDGMPLDKTEWKNYYCISGDGSVVDGTKEKAQRDAEGEIAVGLEISTRALGFDDRGCSEFSATFAAIKDGGSLKNTKIADRFEPQPTQTAGLHVHIGVEDGLDLETAKKAAILGWLLEPCLFSLCNHDRGMTLSNAPIRKYSRLAQTKFDITESEGISVVDGTPDGNGVSKESHSGIHKYQDVEVSKDQDLKIRQGEGGTKDEQPSDSQGTHEEKSIFDDENVQPSEDKMILESCQKESTSTCEGSGTTEDKVELTVPLPVQEDDTSDGLPKEFSSKEKTWISAIFGTRDMGELAELLSGTNVNFMNRRLALAVYNRENDQSTIEFRHFQSTTDENLAWKWVRISAAFVRAASRPVSEYREKLHLIAVEYRLMKSKWKEHIQDRTFQRETMDPWLDSWKWMLLVLDLEDDIPFWDDYVAKLTERNRTT